MKMPKGTAHIPNFGHAVVEYRNMRFLIMDRPSKANIAQFVQELKKCGVHDVVRVCEPTYNTDMLKKEGIEVKVIAKFEQSMGCKSKKIVLAYIGSIRKAVQAVKFQALGRTVVIPIGFSLQRGKFGDWQFDDGAAPPRDIVESWLRLLKDRFAEEPGSTIAIHCVAGLGRAPVLVALALIEGGMKYEDAVEFIRRRRRGAINSKQLEYLEKYKPSKALKNKDKNGCCMQ